ncbi:hypothetical protein Acr_05g0006550 [Actinidia rufa]|uniref:Uncharacterized protein n=1 Tax=Actinidia rufa TaxID=165716 RepID=A0A7J0ELC8_9ERIC|nr:hypothetical protein Acr_05g0006550 [Actinidia rufa]
MSSEQRRTFVGLDRNPQRCDSLLMGSIEVGGATSRVVGAVSDQIGDRLRQIEHRRTKSETGEDKSRPDDPRIAPSPRYWTSMTTWLPVRIAPSPRYWTSMTTWATCARLNKRYRRGEAAQNLSGVGIRLRRTNRITKLSVLCVNSEHTFCDVMEKRSHVDEVLVEIRTLWQAGYSASPDGDVEIKVCSQMRGQASTGDMNPI